MGRIFVGLLAVSLLAACEVSTKSSSTGLGWSKVTIDSGSGFCSPKQVEQGSC